MYQIVIFRVASPYCYILFYWFDVNRVGMGLDYEENVAKMVIFLDSEAGGITFL
jgi:hypothetical protein